MGWIKPKTISRHCSFKQVLKWHKYPILVEELKEDTNIISVQ